MTSSITFILLDFTATLLYLSMQEQHQHKTQTLSATDSQLEILNADCM